MSGIKNYDGVARHMANDTSAPVDIEQAKGVKGKSKKRKSEKGEGKEKDKDKQENGEAKGSEMTLTLLASVGTVCQEVETQNAQCRKSRRDQRGNFWPQQSMRLRQ